jgi:hypothetical protein
LKSNDNVDSGQRESDGETGTVTVETTTMTVETGTVTVETGTVTVRDRDNDDSVDSG